MRKTSVLISDAESIFNFTQKIFRILFMRPYNCFECFKRGYLVAGGTPSGSGLPTVYALEKMFLGSLNQDGVSL